MALLNKKTYVITAKKTWPKNYKKYTIVFASTQLRINRLRKYPIDPKAYLGRWVPSTIFQLNRDGSSSVEPVLC